MREAGESDVLAGGAAHWRKESRLLFQPDELGFPLEPLLLEAGVATVGALCIRGNPLEPAAQPVWVKTTAELRHAFPRIGDSPAESDALRRVLAAIGRLDVEPVAPEREQAQGGVAGTPPRCVLKGVSALMRCAEHDRVVERRGAQRQQSVAAYRQLLVEGFGERR